MKKRITYKPRTVDVLIDDQQESATLLVPISSTVDLALETSTSALERLFRGMRQVFERPNHNSGCPVEHAPMTRSRKS
jgi:hypothetical protein